MNTYKVVEGSYGPARRFAITVGLQEYDVMRTKHSLEEVVWEVWRYLKERSSKGEPYLVGEVTIGTAMCFERGENGFYHGPEPQATYSGGDNPSLFTSYDQIVDFLDELAKHLATKFKQSRVQVVYDGKSWILEEQVDATPTGETS
jgi:hypothetical protein